MISCLITIPMPPKLRACGCSLLKKGGCRIPAGNAVGPRGACVGLCHFPCHTPACQEERTGLPRSQIPCAADEAHTILGCLGESPRCPLPPPNAFLRDTAGCPSQGWWVRPTSGTGSTCSLLEVRLAAPEGGVGLLVACPLGLGRRRGCEPTDLVSVWGVERIYHSCPDDPV